MFNHGSTISWHLRTFSLSSSASIWTFHQRFSIASESLRLKKTGCWERIDKSAKFGSKNAIQKTGTLQCIPNGSQVSLVMNWVAMAFKNHGFQSSIGGIMFNYSYKERHLRMFSLSSSAWIRMFFQRFWIASERSQLMNRGCWEGIDKRANLVSKNAIQKTWIQNIKPPSNVGMVGPTGRDRCSTFETSSSPNFLI